MKKKHLGKKLIRCSRCKGGFWADKGLTGVSKLARVVCPRCTPPVEEMLAKHGCRCKCRGKATG